MSTAAALQRQVDAKAVTSFAAIAGLSPQELGELLMHFSMDTVKRAYNPGGGTIRRGQELKAALTMMDCAAGVLPPMSQPPVCLGMPTSENMTIPVSQAPSSMMQLQAGQDLQPGLSPYGMPFDMLSNAMLMPVTIDGHQQQVLLTPNGLTPEMQAQLGFSGEMPPAVAAALSMHDGIPLVSAEDMPPALAAALSIQPNGIAALGADPMAAALHMQQQQQLAESQNRGDLVGGEPVSALGLGFASGALLHQSPLWLLGSELGSGFRLQIEQCSARTRT